MARSAAIEVAHLVKVYKAIRAVDDVSFEVPRGVVYGILGPNGAGKSPTLRMINDIIAPDAGTIAILGELSPGPVAAARIGYLPEERGLYPKMRVGAQRCQQINIAVAAEIIPQRRAEQFEPGDAVLLTESFERIAIKIQLHDKKFNADKARLPSVRHELPANSFQPVPA